jgi:hypothetical protein
MMVVETQTSVLHPHGWKEGWMEVALREHLYLRQPRCGRSCWSTVGVGSVPVSYFMFLLSVHSLVSFSCLKNLWKAHLKNG